MKFIFIFFHLITFHLLFAAADQHTSVLAGFEEVERTSFGRRRALATGGIVAIITLILILVSTTRKEASSMERSDHSSFEVLRCFSFTEILSAMESFRPSSSVGDKGSGDVYGGLIDGGIQTVTIKWLPYDFLNEVKALSKLSHVNLVSLLGYCSESSDAILVYEAMPLGTLASFLERNASLSWEQRLRICIGAGRGLDYLHTGSDGGFSHGQLNSSKILVDENYNPKIADFRLWITGDTLQDAQRSDVYSFGIILLEVLCGKASEDSSELVRWADRHIGDDGHVDQIVDPRLNGQISFNCLKELSAIIRKCLHDDPHRRLTMVQVVARLELLSDNRGRRVRAQSRESPTLVTETRMREPSTSSVLPMPRNEESMFGDKLYQCSSIAKFEHATQNFTKELIWCHGYYTIYNSSKLLFRGPHYIIYRAKSMQDDDSKFPALVDLSHPNLASMEGYCFRNKETFVGYKNEDYRLLLLDRLTNNLPWTQRLKICIGVAEAVRFLHAVNIIHGGICPTTILLDGSSRAKLATFGYVSGSWSTCTNLPPDIAGSTKMTEKSDVYLFGLLLLIILCGKKIDLSSEYPFLLPNTIREAVGQNIVYHYTDMIYNQIEWKSLDMFMNVALSCCRHEQKDRPSMAAVLEDLKRAEGFAVVASKWTGPPWMQM